MDLLKRAEARSMELRAQGLSERADRLKDAVKMLKKRYQPQPEMPASLAELNSALDELSPLPKKIAVLKNETLAREAEALGLILQKVAPLIPLLDDSEPYYRKSITILNRSERVPLDDDRSFCSEVNLIFYEDGRLTKSLRFCETWTKGFGWEHQEEEELDCASAISLYGLDAIASGLARALKELPSIRIMHQDLEERLEAVTKIQEAFRCDP